MNNFLVLLLHRHSTHTHVKHRYYGFDRVQNILCMKEKPV